MAVVLEQSWLPKELPSLEEACSGEEQVTLFLPDMGLEDAWELLPWSNTANVTIDFGRGSYNLMVPGRH